MRPELFKQRTKTFALEIIRLAEGLPVSRVTNVISNQLLRSGTSVGANYRAACRAKSTADFISKMGTVEEECDETIYWMELLEESGKVKPALVMPLKREASEILAMVIASINTARAGRSPAQSAVRNPKSEIK